MRVALLGRTKILFDTIDKLISLGHKIVLIGTCAAAPEYSIKEKDFEDKAKEIGAVYFDTMRINSKEITEIMTSVNADIALSINWITIVRENAISCFKYGILNAHCGDLPRYRGNACPNWAILMGDKEYAISIHYMNPGELDSGDILIKEIYPIDSSTTITEIYRNMEYRIPEMFCKAVNLLSEGKTKGIRQSIIPEDALRCYPRIPTDSFIDWNESCENIMRNIRASTYPFQGAYCFLNSTKMHIFEASSRQFTTPSYVNPGQVILSDKKSGIAEVATRDGVIVLENVTIGANVYRASDILRSTRIRLNYCLSEEIFTLKNEIEFLREEIMKLKDEVYDK